ncbi:hypothetical protein M2350_003615 [Candidatus Fervidibacter sacchari]|uniref:Uncharacterized protein n=1 Tax=Candidatus Fervidibacter sacchari TaxID=1448929 RepID=A0ABT2ET71_9BACT|nr:hypothetical protein [Candidatus Fervidibacter sacchari]
MSQFNYDLTTGLLESFIRTEVRFVLAMMD